MYKYSYTRILIKNIPLFNTLNKTIIGIWRKSPSNPLYLIYIRIYLIYLGIYLFLSISLYTLKGYIYLSIPSARFLPRKHKDNIKNYPTYRDSHKARNKESRYRISSLSPICCLIHFPYCP